LGWLQPGEPRHNLPRGLFMVPQVRQNCNYIIADFLTLQQPVAVQAAYVDRLIVKRKPPAAKLGRHPQRLLSYIQQHLLRESPEQPEHTQAIFGHPQGHSGVIAALQFQVDQAIVDRLT